MPCILTSRLETVREVAIKCYYYSTPRDVLQDCLVVTNSFKLIWYICASYLATVGNGTAVFIYVLIVLCWYKSKVIVFCPGI